jgi:hypothetical protein
MQVDEDVVGLQLFDLGVVAALEDHVAMVLDLKILAADGLIIQIECFGAQVTGFVKVARRTDDHVGYLVHVWGQNVHANVIYILKLNIQIISLLLSTRLLV